jgi:hypothetical protein
MPANKFAFFLAIFSVAICISQVIFLKAPKYIHIASNEIQYGNWFFSCSVSNRQSSRTEPIHCGRNDICGNRCVLESGSVMEIISNLVVAHPAVVAVS